MAQKQQNAVLEGTLKRRNMMLVQITMAFNRVCKEWKKFDQENRQKVEKLQNDQRVLAAGCKYGKDRIAQYEKELHKTLELAESFKGRVYEIQKERDETVMMLKEQNGGLEMVIKQLNDDTETLKNERDATLRALRETQVKLDESRNSVKSMESQLFELQEKSEDSSRKYEDLLQVKAQLEANYFDMVDKNNGLEGIVEALTAELNAEKSSKDQIRRDIYEEAERKTRMEAERLHDYYNMKVQEILHSATEEAARAEAVLKEQIKRAAMESERKLSECKEKYQREIEALKAEYTTEIEKLKRDILHRQLLISSTVKQLQMSESSNLDPTSLTNPHSQLRKDLFDSLKPQSQSQLQPQPQPQKCADAESVFKSHNNSNYPSSLTRFTLDHLPVAMSKTAKDGVCSFLPDDPLPKNLSRFKTSTPIECQSNLSSSLPNSMCGDLKTSGCGGGGDYRSKHRPKKSDISFNSFLEKVCSEKSGKTSSSSSCETVVSDLKNTVSHLLEAPVKPEKEQVSNMNPSNPSGLDLDPALQKCIQDLLRSYADKFPLEGGVPSNPTNNNYKNNDNIPLMSNGSSTVTVNKSDHVENNNSFAHEQPNQQDCRTGSRSKQKGKDLGKGPGSGPGSSTADGKPPWK